MTIVQETMSLLKKLQCGGGSVVEQLKEQEMEDQEFRSQGRRKVLGPSNSGTQIGTRWSKPQVTNKN